MFMWWRCFWLDAGPLSAGLRTHSVNLSLQMPESDELDINNELDLGAMRAAIELVSRDAEPESQEAVDSLAEYMQGRGSEIPEDAGGTLGDLPQALVMKLATFLSSEDLVNLGLVSRPLCFTVNLLLHYVSMVIVLVRYLCLGESMDTALETVGLGDFQTR